MAIDADSRGCEAADAEVGPIRLSVVVPAFDEAESLPFLHEALVPVLEGLGCGWEILYCDDGSRDGTMDLLRGMAAADRRVRVISFRRNFGQTAALAAGFTHARGEVVVAIDADLQNDPVDIPRLLAKVDEGYDVVSGWRAQRQDAFWTVTLPSRLGNSVIGRVTGVRLHDYGCTLTAYRREILQEVKLYGEMHRFIPAWAVAVGARLTELPVAHHPRRWGRSKYNLGKVVRVLLDLLTVRFLLTYSTKPLYFFGRLGLRVCFVAGLSWTWTITKRIIWGEPLYTDPFFIAGIFLGLAGLQIMLFGLLGELLMRTYYESQGKAPYVIKEVVNVGPDPAGAARPASQRVGVVSGPEVGSAQPRRSHRARWPAPPALAGLAVAAAILLWASPPVVAAQPAEGTLWVGARGGVAITDTLRLHDRELGRQFSAAPGVGVMLHYRLRRVDLGLLIEGLGGGRFAFQGTHRAMGGMFRVAGELRWRFFDGSWGALFVRLTPGYALLAHSDAIRFQAARVAGKTLGQIDSFDHAFGMGFELGLLVYVGSNAALFLGADTVAALTQLPSADDVGYIRLRSLLSLGVEWGL